MRGIEDTSVLGVGLQSGVGQLGVGYLGVRGESLDTDRLSLDLQFALDKTLTARKGPTPTFLRASAATQVNAAGLIEYAPENLVLQSENFGTSWNNNTGNSLVLNDALSPVGTLTADRVDFPATATTGLIKQIQQNFAGAFAGSAVVSASVWLKTVSGTATVYLTLLDGGAPWIRSATACSVTDQWQRFSVSLSNPALSLFLSIGPDTRTTNGTPAQPPVQNAASVHIWGAQLERFSSARTYIPTTTAAVYGARFDHDPVTLACKGLLVEEQRQNLFVRSEEFSTSWVTTDATLSTNAIISPDGNTTADKLIVNSGAANGRTAQTFALTGSHTMSIFAKAGEWSWVFLAPLGPGSGVWFNLSNGTIGTQSAGFTGAITSFGNGWYRCAVTCTGSGVSTSSRIVSTNANSALSTGDGTSGIFLWGAQLEAGSFPTSYIPTTTGPVTRSADVCSITAPDFATFWNASAGSMSSKSFISAGAIAANPFILDFYNASSHEWGTRLFSSGIQIVQRDGVGIKDINVGAVSTQPISTACAFDPLGSAGSAYGSIVAGSAITLNSFLALEIGRRQGGTLYLNGHISSIRYYRKRLPNAKLQSLTA